MLERKPPDPPRSQAADDSYDIRAGSVYWLSRIVSANERGRFTNFRHTGGLRPGAGAATGSPLLPATWSFTLAPDGFAKPLQADGGGLWPLVVDSSCTVGTPSPPDSSSPLSGT